MRITSKTDGGMAGVYLEAEAEVGKHTAPSFTCAGIGAEICTETADFEAKATVIAETQLLSGGGHEHSDSATIAFQYSYQTGAEQFGAGFV